jgi:hypothetical protein
MSNFPEWALRHRKPGTELRCINGHYYLYSVSSKWDKDTKRTKKITGPIIGKITSDGELIPSRKKKVESKKITQDPLLLTGKISIKEFGLSNFFLSHLKPVFEQLKAHFPKYYELIIGVAYCRLLRQSPINQMPMILYHSYLSEIFQNVSFAERNISLALKDIGRDREAVVNFMKSDLPEDEHILIDMTNLPSKSQNGLYAQPGHNNQRNFNGQINLLYIFGNQSLKPIFYRLVPGNIRELSAFLLTMKESNISSCILVMDKGFYSAKNIGYIVKNEFNFICPLKRDSRLVPVDSRTNLFNKTDAHYFEYMGRIIWYIEIEPLKDPSKKIYLYLNDELRIQEEKDYISRLNNKPEIYTIEKFQKKKHHFGTLALLTNIDQKNAEEIYQIYKTRNQIEVMFDGFKGVLEADRTYMQNEETLQGWMFANHIALIAHHRIYRALLDAGKLKKYSINSVIERLALVRKARINGQWVDTEVVKANVKLFQDIGFPVT